MPAFGLGGAVLAVDGERLGALLLGVLGSVDSIMVESSLDARRRALGYGQKPWASASG